MTEQAYPRQDLTELVSDPRYDVKEFWPVYETAVLRELGGLSVAEAPRDLGHIVDSRSRALVEGDPLILKEAYDSQEINADERRSLGHIAYLSLGPLNNSGNKEFWLMESALTQLDLSKFVGDRDQVLRFIDQGSLHNRVRNQLRGSELNYGQKRDLIESVASFAEEAGILRMQNAAGYEDFDTSLKLFESAQTTRDLREGLGGSYFGKKEIDMIRRSMDTMALAVHAHSLKGDQDPESLHFDYGIVQQENLHHFLVHTDNERMPVGRLFEWFTVILDNYYVHKNRLYGEHYAYNAFDYQDQPIAAGVLEKMSHDVVIHDEVEDEPLTSLIQNKLLVMDFLLSDDDQMPEGHEYDHYTYPITVVAADIPIPKTVGFIDERGPTELQIIKLKNAARKNFRAIALQLQSYYKNDAPLKKVLDRAIENKINGGNWVSSARF